MPDTVRMLEVISGKKRGVLAGSTRMVLGMLTPAYRLSVWFRNLAFDQGWKRTEAAGVPVISIGNMTVGGTGKTPLVIWIARLLREHGIRVAVLSRGYKAIEGATNDESLELQRAIPDVPVLENPDRVASARVAVEELEMQALLLDDGFQHRRISRDLNIVLIDATNPFGYGRLLPRGLLREPVGSLARADIVVITRSNLASEQLLDDIRARIGRWVNEKNAAVSRTVPQHWVRSDGKEFPLEELTGKPVVAVCGIGNPAGFFSLLEQSGFRPCRQKAFPDHHHFASVDIEGIAALARESSAVAIVCTVKDLVKLDRNRIGQIPLYALQTGIEFQSGEEMLRSRILELVTETG